MKADIHTIEAKTAGSIELADHIFGLEPRADLIHRVIQWQLNKRQQGTHQAKSRGEISRTTKKLGPQKGSGGARHGSRKSGIFVGGGKAFGPRSRSHETSLNKKIRALGLRHAISAKAKDQSLLILDAAASDGKTKTLVNAFEKLGLVNALIIDGAAVNDSFAKAARSIPNIDVLPIQGINVYDILRRKKLVLTKAAVEALEARFK
ncbi:50S ribosomal protein L4 [Aestuariivirga litoralis]|uniref:Large ribosomal subunit protein uL4 n=1 Tax=Aestuariivirga litoralis TaxID=2650924 RepID=A0A2W2BUC5_9HYPH|nr:50S ribosomal protein L4 [Aestuariivirga litoralis]PZF77076.1 50S ribosomal protein L4 [Aestuariivirga litoralis]